MSNDRKAVILGRLQRFDTVTPRPQAWVPSACCARAGARAAWTLAPRLGHRRGTEGLVRDGGARRGQRGCDPVVRSSGTSPGETGRAARVWKEDWTLVRGAGERWGQERVDRSRLQEV